MMIIIIHSTTFYRKVVHFVLEPIDELGYGIITDSNNNVYITGIFNSPIDFDASAAIDVKSNIGWYDAFLTKYTSEGNYLWTKVIGAGGFDYGYVLASDKNDNIFLAGWFQYTVDFDPSFATDYRASVGSSDVYISKYDRDGNYIWTKTFGGSSDESAYAIKTD